MSVENLKSRLEVIKAAFPDSLTNRIFSTNVNRVLHANENLIGGRSLSSTLTSTSSETNPWRRTISQMSMPLMVNDRCELISLAECKVESEKISQGPFYDRHIVYNIQTEFCSTTRQRRYRDFAFLCTALRSKYPLRCVPLIPRKTYLTIYPLRDNVAFLRTRERGLEEFLFLILNHPILSRDPLVQVFVSAEDFGPIRRQSGGFVTPNEDETSLEAVELGFPDSDDNNYLSIDLQSQQYSLDWLPYDDAHQWTQNLLKALDYIMESVNCMLKTMEETKKALEKLGEGIQRVQFNTDLTTAEPHHHVYQQLVATGNVLVADLAKICDEVNLLMRLLSSAQNMIGRIRNSKYTTFPYLLSKLISAQASYERQRLRNTSSSLHPNTSRADMQKVIRRISVTQSEILQKQQQNAMADSRLKEELVTIVAICKTLFPSLFESLTEAWHKYHFACTTVCDSKRE